jgi:hypothetical protein
MPDYSKGKIYAIRSPNTDKVYIGSTIDTLSRRMSKHRNKFNTTSSKLILEAGDAYIELIEEFPCDNREQLSKREGEIMRATANYCNKLIAGRTLNEYREDNKDIIIERDRNYSKAFYEANKEKRLEYQKAYRAKKKSLQQEENV